MKKLLLLSLLFVACQNTTQSSLPLPSDYSIFESPTEDDFLRWENELDTIWGNDGFMSLPKLFVEEFAKFKDEDINLLKIKYEDITYQYLYDFQKAFLDSAYYTFENLNKYETEEDYYETEFSRFVELANEIDNLEKKEQN